MKQNETQSEIRASKFYELMDLYPFKDFEGVDEIMHDYHDRSYLIIT